MVVTVTWFRYFQFWTWLALYLLLKYYLIMKLFSSDHLPKVFEMGVLENSDSQITSQTGTEPLSTINASFGTDRSTLFLLFNVLCSLWNMRLVEWNAMVVRLQWSCTTEDRFASKPTPQRTEPVGPMWLVQGFAHSMSVHQGLCCEH